MRTSIIYLQPNSEIADETFKSPLLFAADSILKSQYDIAVVVQAPPRILEDILGAAMVFVFVVYCASNNSEVALQLNLLYEFVSDI
jgi:hypothetical protein